MKKSLVLLTLLALQLPSVVSAYDVFLSITDTTPNEVGKAFTSELESLGIFTMSEDVFLADFHVAAIISEVSNNRSGLRAGYAAAIIVIPSFVPTFGINLLHSLVTEADSRVLCREAAGELKRYFDELLPETANYIAENFEAITEYRRTGGKDVGFLE